MINIKKPINTIILIGILFVILGIGINIGKYQALQHFPLNTSQNKTEKIDFSLFWDVWSMLEKKYVDQSKLKPQTMYYGAIKGLVSSLDDQYTFFLTPNENKQSKEDLEGKFEGIGAQLGLKNNRIVIVAPLKNSPAEKAGLKAQDIIDKVDGKSTLNWNLQKAVNTIRGEKGTKVMLHIIRQNADFDISIVRDQIIVPSIELEYRNNIAILKLNRFGEDTNLEWDKSVNEIQKKYNSKEIKAMILDVRDNPGGFLQGAIYIASEFLPKDLLVVKQDYSDNRNDQYFKVIRDGKLQSIPLLVLINSGSASASEIVAGALRDHNRAKLLGEKTFGKGSIQEALDLEGGAGLHVTVARWILPLGSWINGKGIKADIPIKNKTESDSENEADLQLEKALEEVVK